MAPISIRPLPDFSPLLVERGIYDGYAAWQRKYSSWRRGHVDGAKGELTDKTCTEAAYGDNAVWRSNYRRWRQGGTSGAVGEAVTASALPVASLLQKQEGDRATSEGFSKRLQEAPAVVYDVVVANDSAEPALVPVDGPEVSPIQLDAFPPDALVIIRVFRFFEDRSDEKQVWEQELQNVNSGSLVWLPVHLAPGLHSSRGAKYGEWFTVHYIKVYARHFKSPYCMANEGSSYPAKTFGSTAANHGTVVGEALSQGYFWYVSPASSQASMAAEGWEHLYRAGPFDGSCFLQLWRERGSSMEIRDLQRVLNQVSEQ